MQRDMKCCEDLNPCVDVGSDNAKGYITQRIVIATQRTGVGESRIGIVDRQKETFDSAKRHST